MARPVSETNKRKNTEKSLRSLIIAKGLTDQIYQDKIDEYMSFYDNLSHVNSYLKDQELKNSPAIKNYTDAVSEKRRISSEMRNILTFLRLKPGEDSGSGSPEKL